MTKLKTILAPVTLAALTAFGSLALAATGAQAKDGRTGIAVGEINPATPCGGRRLHHFRHAHFGFGGPVFVGGGYPYGGYDGCVLVRRRVFVRGIGFVWKSFPVC